PPDRLLQAHRRQADLPPRPVPPPPRTHRLGRNANRHALLAHLHRRRHGRRRSRPGGAGEMMATNGATLSPPPDVRGKRVLGDSMGIEGRDLAAWARGNEATVTTSDTRAAEALAAAGATAPEGVENVVTGEDLLDPAGFDLVAVSQTVL